MSAYRESTQQSLGFSPFELVYSHAVRGPMRIPPELWTKEVSNPDVKTIHQYVVDFKESLESTYQIANENPEKVSLRYNKGARRKDMTD